jgi:hypothetical protein
MKNSKPFNLRIASLWAVLLIATVGMARAQDASDPADVVRLIYNVGGTDAAPYKLWSPKMKKLWAKQDEAGGYATGALDFAYKWNASDPDVRGLQIAVVHRLDTDAQVRATFGGERGDETELRYDLSQFNGVWLIDDVRLVKGSDDRWVLSEILKLNYEPPPN